MASNYVQDGDRILVTAPSGGVVRGKVVVISNLYGVALDNAVSGANVVLKTNGVFDVTKISGASTSFAVGANVHWDTTNAQATVSATSNTKVGVAVAAAANADTTVRVLLKYTV